MFDADGRPWLIEVNSSPSLARVNKLDHDVKTSMIADTISIVDPPAYDRTALLTVLERRVNGKQVRRRTARQRTRLACLQLTRLRSQVPNARWDSSKAQQMQADMDAFLGPNARPRAYGETPKRPGR